MCTDADQAFFEVQDIFDSAPRERIPKIAVAADGSVLAFTVSCRVMRRSEDGGETWSEPEELESGGNVIVDDNTGDVLVVQPSAGRLLRSGDHGRTWQAEDIRVLPNVMRHGVPGNAPAPVGASESGITVRHGPHKGRLLMPARVQPPRGG
ncbi:MAG: sialidase family protein [Candidatus Brocadiia bacterium]